MYIPIHLHVRVTLKIFIKLCDSTRLMKKKNIGTYKHFWYIFSLLQNAFFSIFFQLCFCMLITENYYNQNSTLGII